MAATQHLHGLRPLPRSESLQKMLDLEKQFKASPTFESPTLDSISPQPQVQEMPMQPRHRDSRESVFLQSQQQGSSTSISVHRTGPASPLSITIPTLTESSNRGSKEEPAPRGMVTDSEVAKNGSGGDDDNNNGGDDDIKSEQSSICQSPSWEGYGQKKKDKKKKQEAEKQKRERDKTSQDPRLSAKRRTTNRLVKTPPAESTGSNYDRARPPSSTSTSVSSSTADTKSGRTTPSGQRSLIPSVWCAATGSGFSGPMTGQSYSRSASAIDTRTDKTETKTRELVNKRRKGKGKDDSDATRGKAYPPLSSRSHGLRNSLLPVHSRQTSASSLTAIPVYSNERTRTPKDDFLYATKNLSDQSVDYSTEPVMRGRQSAEPIPIPMTSGSYVRHVRAQSIERSIKGLMQEAALSDPNLLNAPNRMAFSYIGPSPEADKQETKNRPSSSQSKLGSGKEKKRMETEDTKKDTENSDTSTNFFTFETGPYVPPTPGPATSSSGIISSLKSRIGRRSSISSGSTSNTGKSFKERAMGAIYLQSMVPRPAESSYPSPSKKLSQKSSHTTVSGASAESSVQSEPEPALAAATPATAEKSESQTPTLHKEKIRFLPKVARVLGEINQQTMTLGTLSRSRPSEGSSTSSYHEDSSVPPSPASTPDTSRPQSTKGLSTAMEAQLGSTETLAADKEKGLSEGLGILDEAWSQSTIAPDNDAQSFVTTLTNQKSATSLRSQAGILNLKEAALLAQYDSLGTHPALKDDDGMRAHRTPQHMSAVKEDLVRTTTSDRSSPSAVYLQEARRSAPMVSSPLSKVIRSAKAMPRPPIVKLPQQKVDAGAESPTPPTRILTHEPGRLLQLAAKAPMAKMLVECCHCKFFHDMPSRVYECMAQPDAVVTDCVLGVSGAITTMVKCPWCSHNMSTQCCAGYAAVVYLKERLH
ncbi:hypothetical protein F503_02171 [Ophiostoma piceae UAMH 11346]|uniref:Bgh specific protein n=1 Tax=Ophiostoma piceae (strain UAMH 11346) TaxID=1262450 RepID=S3BY06_OPHP1|nr:hypothetical protein F503_02171 [Ophiostoma piceae UAMH 11346]